MRIITTALRLVNLLSKIATKEQPENFMLLFSLFSIELRSSRTSIGHILNNSYVTISYEFCLLAF